MTGPFDSAWLKWGRAVVHADLLQRHVALTAAAVKPDDFLLGVRHYDPKRHGFPVDLVDMVPPPAVWGLLLGDIANNYRSALDHIAWALVGRGRTPNLPEKRAKGVYFPITSTRDEFTSAIPTRLPGVRLTDVAKVRRVQPYRYGQRRVPRNALTILARLCRHDKHRTIQPVLLFPTHAGYKIVTSTDCVPTTDTRKPRRRAEPLQVGTELGLVRVQKTGPNPDVRVQSQLRMAPGIEGRIPIEEWLTKTCDLIRALLLGLAEPPGQLAEFADPRLFFPA